jgi:DNA-binding GntR family transcriptional regulator
MRRHLRIGSEPVSMQSATAAMRTVPALRRTPGASLAAQVADRIRQAIEDGEFALGEALSEQRLAAALGVSRTPVREALNTLQMQGLIDIRPQSGSFVFMPSPEDVGELCEFRRVMELAGLRYCFARRRRETLAQLLAACDAMDAAARAEDALAYGRADSAFHQAIAENSANEYLIEAYKIVSGRVAALRTHNLKGPPGVRQKSIAEHRMIVAALARGDLARAEAILDEHIARMRTGYRALRRREADPQRR